VNEFEESIISLENIKTVPEFNNRYLKKIFRPGIVYFINLISPKVSIPVFYISMGVSEANRSLPYALFSKNNILFLFDAWPRHDHLINQIVKAYNISKLFVTSRESAKRLKASIEGTDVYWCPEACNPGDYRPSDYKDKNIDVLQFGRKYELWHNMVYDSFMQKGISYSFEKEKGQVVFKDRNEFIYGLGRAKISICLPMNITNNSVSGGISTMTNRYLQSMVSKCLIVGVKPDEMSYVFDYDPVIPIDFKNPVQQIIEILKNFNDYIPFIERNYQECITRHTWKNRWKLVRETLMENQ
jgi:hypothetical protein